MAVTHRVITPGMFIGTEEPNLISFGSGQPDIAPPFKIGNIFQNFNKFKYGKVSGEDELKTRLRTYIKNNFHHSIEKNCIAITNGASEALDLTIRNLSLKIGRKKVLLTRPYYYSYPKLVKINRMAPVYTDSDIDLEDIKTKSKTCSAMIINSPQNPTGNVLKKTILRAIQQITEDNDCTLISDEVYHSLAYNTRHYSPQGENVITINSFSKTYSLCGHRIGYIYSTDADFMKEICEIKSHCSMNTSISSQKLALACLTVPEKHIIKNREIFRKRRNHIYRHLKKLNFEVEKPHGAFYIFPKVVGSMNMAKTLFFNHKVIVYPGDWFGSPGHIRMSFALSIEKINKGIERIENYTQTL